MKYRSLVPVIAAVGIIATCSGASTASAQTATIKMGNPAPAKSSQIRVVIGPWIERVEKDSGGTLKFQKFWGGSLIRGTRKQFEGIINGIQDAATILPSANKQLFPEMSVFALPYMFEGVGALETSIAGWKMYEQGLFSGLEKVKLLSFEGIDNAGIHFRNEVKTLDDIKGLKIRTGGPEEAKSIEELGAVPTALLITQVASALHRGVIDGALSAWSAAKTFRYLPLVKSSLDLPLGTRNTFMAIRKDAYNALPAKARAAIDKNSGLTLSRIYGGHREKEGKQVRDLVKNDPARNFVKVTDSQRAALKKRLMATHDAWKANTKNGAKVYNALKKILADMKAGRS